MIAAFKSLIVRYDVENIPTLKHLVFWEDLGDGEPPVSFIGHKDKEGNFYYFPETKINTEDPKIVAWGKINKVKI